MKASIPVGQEIDWTLTYLEADREALRELPWHVTEFMAAMIAPPRPAIVLESVMLCGVFATMLALREQNMLSAIHRVH